MHTHMKRQRSSFVRFNDGSNHKTTLTVLVNHVKDYLKNVCKKWKTEKEWRNEKWRKTVLLACVVALGVDPLFLFVPVIDSPRFCFTFDKKLGAAVSVIRTFNDTFYVVHIIYHFITEVTRSQVSLHGELTVHHYKSKAIRKIIYEFHFIVDILSVLPIPQVVLLSLMNHSDVLVSKVILKWIILIQYIPRVIRIYPLMKEVTRASDTIVETKWIGAAFNLFLYMIHSHVFGAFWYVSAVEKKNKCWRMACADTVGCVFTDQYCRRGVEDHGRYLYTSCPLIDPDDITSPKVFNFGMYIDALKSGIVEKYPEDFPRKFFYCFWWGLRNISALGQNLKTSNSVGDIVFALIICVSGLLLFSVLIGNVQKYLQSTTIRLDEMKEKMRDTEKWMSNRMLPEYLKGRIRRYENYKWRQTRGIEDETLLLGLPKDLRIETKRHLYLNMLHRVPWLSSMDDSWLLEALCDRVNSVCYLANTYIMREGDPVDELLIVTRGRLKSLSASSDCGSYGLSAGDVCGELLFSLLNSHFSSPLPTSDRTILTETDVEGFVLLPDDLKFVASHLIRFHFKKLRHMFRFYSALWRAWAVRFIQAAWRKHYQRKQMSQGSKVNLGATLVVSRFVSKALRNRREINETAASGSQHWLPPPSIPHKPSDLEFTKEGSEE